MFKKPQIFSEQFQQAMAQAANQLQKIQKKAAQQQNSHKAVNSLNLVGNPNLGLSGSERPLHQPTKAQLTMPAVLQQRQMQKNAVNRAGGGPGQPPFPVGNIEGGA